jgi:hypothetical protein
MVLWAAMISLGLVASGCESPVSPTPPIPASNAKTLTGFIFTSPAAAGSINEETKTINVTVPYGTNVGNLTPTITHTGVSIDPASGEARDFTTPVQYTVWAEDESTAVYTVTVTVGTSATSKAITGFRFTSPAAVGSINEGAKTISVTVPYGTERNGLVPVITHTGVSIDPASGARDFTNPVQYIVRAENGTTAVYTVTVTVAPATSKEINDFSFVDPAVAGNINAGAKTISVMVPYGTNVGNLAPVITYTGESINPASGAARDFTNPVQYTVRAENGTTAVYTVTVTVAAPATSKAISGFIFTNPAAITSINEESKTISVTVPYGTERNGLVPVIIHTGESINPASGAARDFTNPVQYIVSAEDGSTAVYTVTVGVAKIKTLGTVTGMAAGYKRTGSDISNTIKADINVSGTDSLNNPISAISSDDYTLSMVNPGNTGQNETVTLTVPAGKSSTGLSLTKNFTVYIQSDARAITGFSFTSPAAAGTISGTNIGVLVPYGTNVTGLSPTITVSPQATVTPASGAARDFTNPVQYTVSAEDGTTAVYTVTVGVAKIKTLGAVTGMAAGYKKTGSDISNTIKADINVSGTDNLNNPISVISSDDYTLGAVTPGNTGQNETVTLTVPAGKSSTGLTLTKDFTVYIQSDARAISGFSFTSPAGTGTISGTNIGILVPYGTNVTGLSPTITVSPQATVTPASGTVRDFTNPVQYTVSAEDGTPQHYTVTITVRGQGGVIPVNPTDAASGALSGGGITIARAVGIYLQKETLGVTGTFDTYKWRVDGTVKGTGNSLVLNAVDYSLGPHQVSLEVTLNGIPYSKAGTFTVVP